MMFARDVQAIANTVWLVINQSTRKGNIHMFITRKKYASDTYILVKLAKNDFQVRLR